MRINLAKKITIVVVSVLVLGILSNGLAIYSSWQVNQLLHFVLENHLPSVVAGDKMETALFEHRGLVSSYMLDQGNPRWLKELDVKKAAFLASLVEAHRLAYTDIEHKLLAKIDAEHEAYDRIRTHALAVYDSGDLDTALQEIFGPLREQGLAVLDACRAYSAANEQFAHDARVRATRQVQWSSALIGASMLATLLLSGLLIGTLHYGIWQPLRKMRAEAEEFTNVPLELQNGKPSNDLELIGQYFSALMLQTSGAETHLNRARQQLVLSERLAAVGKLAASLAHEIRNPLTSMKLWLYSIQTSVGGTEAINRKLRIVSDEIHRLENVVNNFLDFSRPGALKRTPQSVPGLIDKTLDLVRHRLDERQVTVCTQFDPAVPQIMGDLGQLKQVLINLIENAVAAMKPGGGIGVDARFETNAAGQPAVVVRVRDSGTGIPPEVRPRIFEPFFSTKEEGAGLGLCIAAQIVAQHNGRLVLEATSESGTTFALWLEAVQEPVYG